MPSSEWLLTHSWDLSSSYKRECPSLRLIKISALTWKQNNVHPQQQDKVSGYWEYLCLNAWKKKCKTNIIKHSPYFHNLWLQGVKANHWINLLILHPLKSQHLVFKPLAWSTSVQRLSMWNLNGPWGLLTPLAEWFCH